MNLKRKVIAPSYYKDFICDSNNCDDICCIGSWMILVDKDHYSKWMNLNNNKIRYLIDTHVVKIKERTNDQAYAMLMLKEEDGSKCCFLNNENLCDLHLKYGEGILCNTCRTYPRHSNKILGTTLKCISVSCPIASKLILENKKGIEFIEFEEDTEIPCVYMNMLNQLPVEFNFGSNNYFENVQWFCIQIIKSRDYFIWERMAIVGLFIKGISEAIKTKKQSEIPEIIDMYKNLIVSGSFKEMLSEIPASTKVQVQILKQLVDIRLSLGINNNRYLSCLNEFLNGIGCENGILDGNADSIYNNAYNSCYYPFMKDREYIYENYLVNYMFMYLFPYGDNGELFDNYLKMAVHFSLIKMHLIGISNYYKDKFDEDKIYKLIQSIAKSFEHNPGYVRKITELLKENDYANMTYITILLKN